MAADEANLTESISAGRKRRAQGLCWHCNESALPSASLCAKHLARYKERRTQGLCQNCENPRLPKIAYCATHREMRHEQVRQRHRRKAEALGDTICSVCQMRPRKGDLKSCQICLDRAREQALKRTMSGRCRLCDLPPEPNRIHCAECLKRLCLAAKEKYCGGQWEITLGRDKNRCRLCGMGEKLVVHHIDGTGKGRRGPVNNAPENLVTLCSRCHVCLETLLHRYKDMELLFRLAHRLPLDQPLE